MNKYILAFAAVGLMASSCTRVPISGRRQMNLFPESQMMGLSLTAYKDFLTKNKTVTNPDAAMVKRVGDRMAAAVKQYLTSHKMANRIQGYNWEFNLVESKDLNAWCMPGGKVVVYTGLLPVTKTEAGLAVVMGHEIAHAIARHGNERMSQSLALQLGGMGAAIAMQSKPQETQNIFNQSIGVGSALGSLAHGRKQESEADDMGLIFMALAGYNPEEAITFWQRMASAAGSGQKPPEFLSTHPSDATRIAKIKASLPKAKLFYKPN
jgi:predicted Zn-dependent protease